MLHLLRYTSIHVAVTMLLIRSVVVQLLNHEVFVFFLIMLPNNAIVQETGEQLDLDEYDHMVFRVHGDGRKYIANLRTENWLVGGRSHDVWQAFLFAR